MPQKTEYAPGLPAWVDLATPDPAAAGTFYGQLFGWKAEPVADDDSAGGYTMLTLDGRNVGALAPLHQPGQPTAWTTHIATDDVDKTVEIAQSAGGTVITPAMDVFTSGRLAVIADPTGAAIALWQAGDHHGADVVDEPGAFAWAELNSRDTAAAERFYTEVFGWTAETSSMGEMAYTEFKLGDTSVAGMMAINPQMPAEIPSYWMPYFAVTDPDKTAREAAALGAKTMVEPQDFPGGRFSILTDPQGAMFGVLRLTPKS